ncbi:hypothetical protein [Actinokineospora inagensis]|uniref:hypothetical protein n=1 Tax=Actinokineospora inagensis TaxID=103730 RepID=UPI00041FDA3C|nr:hypothetical protein [Actinokineospora inagensis]
MDLYVADANNDGTVDTAMVDTNGDHVADAVASDVDGDGQVDVTVYDLSGDGYADVAYDHTAALDHSIDPGYSADPGYSTDPTYGDLSTAAIYPDAAHTDYSDISSAYPAPYDIPSGTQAVMDMTTSGLADAHTLYQDALHPGSVSADDVAAANQHIDTVSRNTAALEGQIYADQVDHQITVENAQRSALTEAHETATDLYIGTDQAISRAQDAIDG